MSSAILSAAVVGLRSSLITVEADVVPGLPKFTIVGLPDAAVTEAKERVRSAIRSGGYPFPRTQLVVNLAPASIRKEGPAFDLPMALAVISRQRDLSFARGAYVFLGELALDGTLRPTTGVLLAVSAAQSAGIRAVVVPLLNAEEASLIAGVTVYAAGSLSEVMLHLQGSVPLQPYRRKEARRRTAVNAPSPFDHVMGQEHAKRALEIAAAGGHNCLFFGPPGSGKTMLARAFRDLLPPLSWEEALEVTKIYSVAGLTSQQEPLITCRPFRTPHHTASPASLIGGGRTPRPGEISLAHRGVLFLDEFPEFPRAVTEALRQPLEDRRVTIARVFGSVAYPAQCMFIAAANPCPCGFRGDPAIACRCSPADVAQYLKRLSGPILDRIDLTVWVPRPPSRVLFQKREGDAVDRKSRIRKARERQMRRFRRTELLVNAEMSTREIEEHCQMDPDGQAVLTSAMDRMHLSMRSAMSLLKVARTIADLAESEKMTIAHLTEALQYRMKDREGIT